MDSDDDDRRECNSLAAQALSAGSSSSAAPPSAASPPRRSPGLLDGGTTPGASGDGEDLDGEFGLLLMGESAGEHPDLTDRSAASTGTTGDRPVDTVVSNERWVGDADHEQLGTLPGDDSADRADGKLGGGDPGAEAAN